MTRNIEDFIDGYGFILHKDRDGNLTDAGDSTQRTATVLLLNEDDVPKLVHLIDFVKLVFRPGEPVRHWAPGEWTGKPGSMSRDNFSPVLVLLASTKPLKPYTGVDLWTVVRVLFWRGGFLWNTVDIAGDKKPWYIIPDWIGFRNIATIIRGLCYTKSKAFILLYPLLIVLDLAIFIQSVIQVVQSWFEGPKKWKTSNDLNLAVDTIYTQRNLPTPLSVLGRLIYRHRRNAGDNNGRFKNMPGPYSAFASYYRDPKRHPPIHEVCKKSLMKI